MNSLSKQSSGNTYSQLYIYVNEVLHYALMTANVKLLCPSWSRKRTSTFAYASVLLTFLSFYFHLYLFTYIFLLRLRNYLQRWFKEWKKDETSQRVSFMFTATVTNTQPLSLWHECSHKLCHTKPNNKFHLTGHPQSDGSWWAIVRIKLQRRQCSVRC